MVLQVFTTAILFLSIASVKTYHVPYQNIQLFSITPKLIYTSESNPVFGGYSYTTQDFNGGESNVIFTTGADSASKLKDEMNSMKMSEGHSQKDKNQENIMSSEQQFKFVKAEENKNKQDLDSNIKVLNEEKKFAKNPEAGNLLAHQINLQQVSFTDVPYPVFRENLLNLPGFPSYQISPNVIQSQYYLHNPYARLELPLHNFDFFNPTVPQFYQAGAIIPDGNSKLASTAVENMKASTESDVTKSSQINATSSESNSTKSSIESRFNLESTTNAIEETSSQSAISTKKLESTTTSEKSGEEVTSKSAGTSQNTVEQTTDNKASSTELASTE